MFLKFTHRLLKNLKKYDKKATNPFLKNGYNYDNRTSLYEKTYVWVEENKDD